VGEPAEACDVQPGTSAPLERTNKATTLAAM
jgi:hypothetical protein